MYKEGHKCYTGPGSSVLGYETGKTLDYCATRCFETDLVSQGCSHVTYNPKYNGVYLMCSYTIGCDLRVQESATVYVPAPDEVSTTTAAPPSVPSAGTRTPVRAFEIMIVAILVLYFFL